MNYTEEGFPIFDDDFDDDEFFGRKDKDTQDEQPEKHKKLEPLF